MYYFCYKVGYVIKYYKAFFWGYIVMMGNGNDIWVLLTLIFGWILSMMNSSYSIVDDYANSYEYDYSSDYLVQVEEEDKPAMLEARIEGDVDGYYIWNTYDSDYMSRDVVGMVGVPIELESNYSDRVDGQIKLVFVYDESKLSCDVEEFGIGC